MINLVTICHQSYYNIIDYIPHAVHFIPVTYFKTGSLYLLISLTDFVYPPSSLPSGNPLFVPCIYESVFVCFVF